MRTVYYAAASLDGFLADAGHGLDWLMQFGDPEGSTYPRFIERIGALAMGASTYEWLLRHSIFPETGAAAEWPYAQPAWVFTHRELRRVPGADLRFVAGDVRPVHAEMTAAAAGRDLWIVGGGELAGAFHDAGLLDEVIVQVTAVTLGEGKPLLPRRIATPPLRLTGVERFGDSFVELRYDVPKP